MLIYALDDEESALYYLESAIREAMPQAEVRTFERSKALLQAFEEQPADVVFSDIEMPGLSGINLAKAIMEIRERTNIVFVTGYENYALEALNLFASGYLLKPVTAEKVRQAIENLRYEVGRVCDISLVTFGNFDVFFRGVPVTFRSPKSKELLAYLVDRNGATVTRQEAAAALFEDDYSRAVQANLSRIATRMTEDLEAAGIHGLVTVENGYRVNLAGVACDLADYLAGSTCCKYTGEYMEQYSWGEYRKAGLLTTV